MSSTLGVDAGHRNVAGGDGVENIGFAIPVDAADPLIEQGFGEAA
jgi:S1-C subfamily serine protease